jgi:hypothetical protein
MIENEGGEIAGDLPKATVTGKRKRKRRKDGEGGSKEETG